MRVLFLDLDTLRPDHLGCYGYLRDTSPNIDRIARQGVRFDQYYCPNAPCLPSRASLVSGRYGIRNGVLGHGGTAADMRPYGKGRDFRSQHDENGLWYQFRKAGFHTASISTFAERHSAWWFNAGFHEWYNVGAKGDESAEEIMPIAARWLNEHAAEDNWLLHINFWDAHTPYRAPASYGEPFAGQPLPDFYTPERYERQKSMAGPFTLQDQNMYDGNADPRYPRQLGTARSYEDMRRILDAYDTGIRYMDEQIGLLLDILKRQSVLDDTAVIITSDHGESMGELGIYSEHATADEAISHIPMIIRWPGGQRGTVDTAFHANVDLAPTIAELLRLPAYEEWDGKSYARTLLTGEQSGLPYVVLTQCAHVFQRAVRFDRYLYIRTYHCGYHLFDEEMLFDIQNDPFETQDLKDRLPELCDRGAHLLSRWVEGMLQKTPRLADPLWTAVQEGPPHHCEGQLAAYCVRLEQTGRAEAAARLREKYPEEL
ncbi:MAG: sulfatase [Eubacteriales bacterium]|nr:sulfatase [Eubacteriales bacterium]